MNTDKTQTLAKRKSLAPSSPKKANGANCQTSWLMAGGGWGVAELCAGFVGVVVFFVVKVEAELRVFFGAGDFDGEFGAALLAFEEGIDGFEEEGFYAGGGMRQLGLHDELAVKVEFARVHAVGTSQLNVGAGDAEAEVGKGDDSVIELKAAFEFGGVGAEAEIFGMALGAAAERVHFAFGGGIGETHLFDAELAIELEAIDHVAIFFGNEDFGFETRDAGQEGIVRFDGETKEIFDAGTLRYGVEVDGAAFHEFVFVDDGAAGDDCGLQEMRGDVLEDGVAVRTVHDGGVIGVERDGIIARAKGEIGSVRVALDGKIVERAAEFSF